MSLNTGPPSKNTHTAACAAQDALKIQSIALCDKQSTEQSGIPARPDDDSSQQESSLMSVAVSTIDHCSEGKSSSRGGTVHEILDEVAEPELSYTTVLGSFGFTSSLRCFTSTPFAGGDTLQWETRDLPLHQNQPDEDWGDLAETIGNLAYTVRENQCQAEDILESLESIKHQSKDVLQKLDNIQC